MSALAGARATIGVPYVAAALAASVVTALLIGVPTDVVPNPWFTRMTPVRPLDVALLPAISLTVGALAATYLGTGPAPSRPVNAGIGSGALGWLAIGCPVCNKLVVLLVGASGAMQYFAPAQPVLGATSVLLAALALRARWRAVSGGCRVADDAGRP